MKSILKDADLPSSPSSEVTTGGNAAGDDESAALPAAASSELLQKESQLSTELSSRRSSSAAIDRSNHSAFSLVRSSQGALDLARELTKASVTDPSLLGSGQCSCIVVNYINAGYILLPFAFSEAGLLYSTVVFSLVALQSYITSLFILETCARAESANWVSSCNMLPRRYSMAIRETKYELSSLQQTFLGPRGAKFFICTTACDLYMITWTLASIFGQAMAEEVSLRSDTDDYKLWIGIFMAITLPLSCTSILDQALLQLVFLGGRMLMVLLMIGTLCTAFVDSSNSHFGEQIGAVADVPLADFSHTITIIQTAIFATAFQFSVPGMASVSANKKSMTSIFRNAVSFVYASNCVLAIMMAVYFGSSTASSSNLSWSVYHAGSQGWAKFVSGYVVLFAALDGLAVFPLVCVSLGDILLAGAFGDKAHIMEKDIKWRTLFRILAAFPQLVGAFFVSDLGVLAKYGGIFTLLSYTAAPAALYIASGRSMEESGLPSNTFYSSKLFSHNWLAFTLLTLVGLIIVGVVVDSIVRGTGAR